MKDFLSFLKPYKKPIVFAFISIVIANLLSLAFPWAIKVIIDEVLPRKNTSLLNNLSIGLVLVFALKFYFGYLREYLVALIGESVVCDLRNRLYRHLHQLSVRYIENTPSGKLISGIIGDVESVRNFLFGGLLDFVYSFFNIFFVAAILFVLDWRLALVSLIYMPVFGITFFKLAPRLKSGHSSLREKYADLTSRLNEVFRGIRVVSGFSREEYEAEIFQEKQAQIVRLALGNHKLGVLLWMISEFLSSLGLVTLIWFGANAVINGRISSGTLLAFYAYLGMLFFPVIKLVVINNYYQEAAASLERINLVLAEEPRVAPAPFPFKPGIIRGDVSFGNVSFGYTAEKEVLSRVNLEVKAADSIALVGKSGAGKTTLINLLLRFYDPTAGVIFIDGRDLRELDLKEYRSRIAMVLQDDYLFSGSVKENIRYARPAATDEEVVRVAKSANADEFITRLASGYDTEIGERGVKLSFGQRQRISIARAILRDPSILVLDEATSSVDSETERLIIEQAFRKLMAGRTTFIIAHRLSTITYANRIVLIDQGKISEIGSHSQLLENKGNYWRMWQEQSLAWQD